MKNNLRRALALLFSFTLIIGNFNMSVFANELNNEVQEDSIEQIADENVAMDESLDLSDDDLDSEMEDVEYNDEIFEGDQSILHYFLVDQPYLSTPDTEKFILSLTDVVDSVSIIVESLNGKEFELIGQLKNDNVYYFEKNFTNEESGEYLVSKIFYNINEKKYVLNLESLEMDVRFGVNQKYNGYGKSENVILDENGNELIQKYDEELPSIISVNEDNINQSENAFIETLSFPSTYAMDSKLKPFVVAIDPGHGGSDSGMVAVNGGYEKDYVLKISNYLKKELEQYSNVKIVMTRTSDEYVGLEERAQIAKNANADILVSLHLNATGLGTQSVAKGAEVYYPHANYRPDVHAIGKNLAINVQNELVALGLYNRGIKVKYVYDTETFEPANDPRYDYPDGSVGDYYGIIRHSKKLGIAAIIVEHCMADNWDDFNKFLSSEQKLLELAQADARGIAKALGLNKDQDNSDEMKQNKLDTLARENKDVIKDGIYTIHSSMNVNYVLDVENKGITNTTNIQLWELNESETQAWKINHDEKGYVTFININSGKALDVSGANAEYRTNIQLWGSNGTNAQKWIVKKDGTIISALNKDFVLDLQDAEVKNTSNIQLWGSNGTDAQKWIFKKNLTPIMGSSDTTVSKMVQFFNKYNKNYDLYAGSKYNGVLSKGGASTIEEFCKIYYEEARDENVKVEVAFTQSMLETGWLTFKGDVKPSQYNFAGMGATGNGNPGNQFKDVREGIRAHIQHLKCYASTESLNKKCVDPRWSNHLRGKAEFVEYLSIPNNPYNIGWAADPNYASKILNLMNCL